jgi:hypothetical protein
MKSSRKVAILAVALTMVGAGCSRFAPKAGVGVKKVGVDLAFGIDVETLLTTPPPFSPPPTTIPPPPPTSQTTSIIPPEPPPPPSCLPPQTQTIRDGGAPTSIHDQEYQAPHNTNQDGSRPREGAYFTYFEWNLTGEPVRNGFDYRDLSKPRAAVPTGFGYDVRTPAGGHRMDIGWVVIPPTEGEGEEGGGSAEATPGIYLQELRIPYKDSEQGEKRIFSIVDPGALFVRFPLSNGAKNTSAQAVSPEADAQGEVPVIGGGSTVMTVRTEVGSTDRIFVCDQLASAWRVAVTIEISGGDADVRITGNMWLATQYGGWSIQELLSINGGADLISGNFFTRSARLDPGKVPG